MRRTAIALILVSLAGCGGEAGKQAPPEAAASSNQVGSVKSYDGVPIAYSVAGSGEGALLFIHSWSCDRSYWTAQVGAFASNQKVVTVDLAGHGDSGAEREAWTIEALARDVEAVIAELDLASVVLVGHSMGGPVALEVARRLPDRVVGVIGVDAFQGPEWNGPEAENLCAAAPQVAATQLAELAAYDLARALSAVRVPVRAINGSLVPTRVEAVRARHRDFDAVILDGVGHFPMLERPDEFNRQLERLVEEITAGAHDLVS